MKELFLKQVVQCDDGNLAVVMGITHSFVSIEPFLGAGRKRVSYSSLKKPKLFYVLDQDNIQLLVKERDFYYYVNSRLQLLSYSSAPLSEADVKPFISSEDGEPLKTGDYVLLEGDGNIAIAQVVDLGVVNVVSAIGDKNLYYRMSPI